jgi:transcriptional regulator with XRE-family HTH domain
MSSARAVGDQLRDWRQRRRLSQLTLALDAEISTRHLSFIETGRAAPSREMLLRLADQLDVPLRERNVLLVSAGFAPVFQERALDAPELQAARKAVDLLLAGHEPYPALAVDRHWTLVAANGAVNRLLVGVAPRLLEPPVNVLRVSLHPDGLATRIVNLIEWRGHLLDRLRRQIEISADPVLGALIEELRGFPVAAPAAGRKPTPVHDYAGVLVPLRLRAGDVTLSLFSTTTVFGTPVDVTLSELALESFFPADAATADALRRGAEDL